MVCDTQHLCTQIMRAFYDWNFVYLGRIETQQKMNLFLCLSSSWLRKLTWHQFYRSHNGNIHKVVFSKAIRNAIPCLSIDSSAISSYLNLYLCRLPKIERCERSTAEAINYANIIIHVQRMQYKLYYTLRLVHLMLATAQYDAILAQ